MSRWWRAYDEALNDPKIQILGLEMIGAWFNLMCLASKNKGVIKAQDVAWALRISKHKAAIVITKLATGGLLDRDGDDYTPHNWAGRQYQSDASTERVKRHRDKRVAAGLERQWTAPKELRQAVYARDGFKCVYCGSEDRLSLDHRTPEIRGGTHDIENLATACMACNGAKRDLTEDEFRSRNGLSNGDETLLKRPQTTEQNISEQNTSLRSVRARRGTPFPEGEWLTEQDREFATSRGLNPDGEFPKFRDHALAKGRLAKDWHAAWRNWITSPYQKTAQNQGQVNGHGKRSGSILDAIDRLDLGESGADQAPSGHPVRSISAR